MQAEVRGANYEILMLLLHKFYIIIEETVCNITENRNQEMSNNHSYAGTIGLLNEFLIFLHV